MNAQQRLARVLARAHPLEAAQTLENLSGAERGRRFGQLPLDTAVGVLVQMESSVASAVLAERSPSEVATTLAALPSLVGVRILERLDADRRGEVLARMPAAAAAAARRLMRYAGDSAGALMDRRFAAVPADISVSAARKRIQEEPRNLLFYLYVVDRKDHLVGVVSLSELWLAPRSVALSSIMQTQVERLSVRDNRETIINHQGWRSYHALPVVDREGVLVGVLRYKTLRLLETDPMPAQAPGLLPAGLVLGELYWSAATSFLLGIFDVVASDAEIASGESSHGS